MNKRVVTRTQPTELRRRAEKQLRGRRSTKSRFGTDSATQALVHELEVHQIELELQNEELRAARSEAEAALERYTEFYEFAPLGYAVIEANGTIRELNLAGARLFGVERSKIVGRHIEEFVVPSECPIFGHFFVNVLEGEQERRWECEIGLLGAEGSFDAHLVAALQTHPSTAVLLALEDVTQQRRSDKALRAANVQLCEADTKKNEFLAVLSHELRNPLTPIRNSLFVLDRVTPGSEKSLRAREILNRQVAQLSRIVDDLLEVSRISHGKLQVQPTRLELRDLVRHTAEDHGSLIADAGLELEMHLNERPLWVSGDAARLSQALSNLLSNAVKFTSRGGRLFIHLESDENRRVALIRVRDTGAGIPPEMIGHLFEPFTQADRTLERGRGGLGLGLALARGLIEQHGGTLEAFSPGPGGGAEFTIRLPSIDHPADSTLDSENAQPAKAPRRVLVIEDNLDAADSLREALELEGNEVAVAYSGPEGLKRARAFAPTVVLCDIGLPHMDGYEVARAMRADPDLRSVRLVALSGYAQPEDVAKAKEAGFHQHLAKPPNIHQLLSVLETRTG